MILWSQAMTKLLTDLIQQKLGSVFELYDLGLQIDSTSLGFYVTQTTYAFGVLQHYNMDNFKPCNTPSCLAAHLTAYDGTALSDPSTYLSMVGALQNISHPPILTSHLLYRKPTNSYNSPQMFTSSPFKRILWCVQGTLIHGLHLSPGR